jgi:hypothetical protein
MKVTTNLLSIIARLNTPVKGHFGPHDGLAALNPQPLPPMELGRMSAAEYVRMLWIAQHIGGAGQDHGFLDPDIWCPLGVPRFKLPPLVPPCDPDPQPEWLSQFYLGFASHIAAIMPQIEGSDLKGPASATLKHASTALEKSLR